MMRRYRRLIPGGEAARRALWVTIPVIVAGCLGACSISPGDAEESVAVTGSIPRTGSSPLSPDLGQEDWRRAKGALAIALDPQGSGAAVKWDNPDSEVSGTFTPVAQPFVKQNEICRAFIATISFPGRSSSLQGTGCRLSADDWRITEVRPWRKPT